MEEVKEVKKKKVNPILFTIVMGITFLLITELFIYGIGSSILLESILYYPQGNLVIEEVVLAFLVLIVMLKYDNFYVFTQKKEKFSKGFFYGLFYIIIGILFIMLRVMVYGADLVNLSLVNIMVGSLFIGICEEFLCRGWLLNEFLEKFGDTKKGVWFSIIASGIIFGLLHLSNYYGGMQGLLSTIYQCLTAAASGIVWGLIYYKTKNIWSVIFLHAFWDFSIFLGYIVPVYSMTESIINFSLVAMVPMIGVVLAELLNLVPHIKNIDGVPSKVSVILVSIFSVVLFLGIDSVFSDMIYSDGDTYNYDEISINEYSITQSNYSSYSMNYIKTNIDGTSSESYSFKLSLESEGLVLKNEVTGSQVSFDYEEIYDYYIKEYDTYYIIACIGITDIDNNYLFYNYLNKEDMSNDDSYLESVKEGMKKYLLPSYGTFVEINDREEDKSYLSYYNVDYGYYLLVEDEKMARLTE